VGANAAIPDGNFEFASQSPMALCQPSSICKTSKGKSLSSSKALVSLGSLIAVPRLYHEHQARGALLTFDAPNFSRSCFA